MPAVCRFAAFRASPTAIDGIPVTSGVAAITVVAAIAVALMSPLGGVAAAQEIHLTGLDGAQLDDAELGKGTCIAVVWATWSPGSHDIVERVHALAGHWARRARLLTLDFEEDRPTVVTFLAGRSLDAPTFLDVDGTFSKKYAVATLPGLLVLVDGKVKYHGKLPEDPDPLLTSLVH